MNAAELRRTAVHAINEAISANLKRDPKLRGNLDKLFALVAKAYPFDRRKRELVRFWAEEIAAKRIELAERPVGGKDIDRPCPVCRVKAGESCRSVGEHDVLNPEFMAAAGQHNAIRGNKAPGRVNPTQKQDVMHPQRRDPNAPMTGVVSAA